MRWHSLVAGMALVGAATVPGSAQAFTAGSNYIGPFIGLSTYGSTAAFGGDFEHAINDKWGWGLSASYWTYSSGYASGGYSYSASVTSYVVGGTVAYHFAVSDPKLDPFVGGFIGYYGCSGSSHDNLGNSASYTCGHASSLFPGAFGGIRYWFSDNIAVTGRLGWGVGTLAVGVDFKM